MKGERVRRQRRRPDSFRSRRASTRRRRSPKGLFQCRAQHGRSSAATAVMTTSPRHFQPVVLSGILPCAQLERPNWYLPTWYGNMPPDRFRLEQCLSFMTNLQGMITPPDMEPARNPTTRQRHRRNNRLFQQLGPSSTTCPSPSRPSPSCIRSHYADPPQRRTWRKLPAPDGRTAVPAHRLHGRRSRSPIRVCRRRGRARWHARQRSQGGDSRVARLRRPESRPALEDFPPRRAS